MARMMWMKTALRAGRRSEALATGNPLIIEKCNMDIEVARLNMLKASHLNQVYALEELVYRKYPEERSPGSRNGIEGYEQVGGW